MKSQACYQVRQQTKAQALSCISPIETELGFKVNTLVTWRGITFHMKYLEEHESICLYYDAKRGVYRLYKDRKCYWKDACPPEVRTIVQSCSRLPIILHSIFCQAMRIMHRAVAVANAADAARAARAARAIAAADAAYDAAYAVAVADAAFAARAAAARAVAAYAADATYAARADAAYAYAADMRKAFRLMIKWRKTQ